MTTANKITIIRILLIPVFVLVTLDYIRDFRGGTSQEWQRILAYSIFALAAVSDALDGYIARRYKQITELGVILDPLADKTLLVSALILLSIDFKGNSPFHPLPLWLPVLVISRDLILLGGAIIIHMTVGRAVIRPRFFGKAATFFQMLTIGWIFLQIEWMPYKWFMYAAGFFTFVSGLWYIRDGAKQLNAHEPKQV